MTATLARARSIAAPCHRPRCRWLLALVLTIWGITSTGRVQAADDPAARSLFEAGLQLMDEGKVDQACPKFEESLKLQPSVGAQLNLARCHELQGKIATAWTEYRSAAKLARDLSDPKREEAASMLADGLEPKLPKLVITVETPTPGLTVTRDGTPLGEGSFGLPVAIDPGDHRLEAAAEGYQTWSTVVHIPTEAVTRTVAVPELEPRAAGGAGGGTAGRGDGADSSDTLRVTGYVLGATGVVATTVGAILGGLVLADASDAESDPALCPDKLCYAEGQDVIDGAYGKATASSVLLPVGGACLLTGVALVIVAEMSSSEPDPEAAGAPSARLVPALGGMSGLILEGTF